MVAEHVHRQDTHADILSPPIRRGPLNESELTLEMVRRGLPEWGQERSRVAAP
jgi:hypothetical protein